MTDGPTGRRWHPTSLQRHLPSRRFSDGTRTRATALLMLTALAITPAFAQDAPAALARAERAYAQVRSLRADFEQTITNPMLGGPEVARGTLFLVKPDRFAMRFTEPAGDRIIADGTWLWAYTPSTVPGQVIRQPVPTSGAATPNLFAQFVERPLERYDVTYAGRATVAGEPVELVTLVPIVDGLGFRRATIAIAEGSGWIRQLQIVEDSGQRRTIELTAILPNAKVPADEVRFTVPHGVKIVTP
jgi:outer membrane lipoprotein carrier protein